MPATWTVRTREPQVETLDEKRAGIEARSAPKSGVLAYFAPVLHAAQEERAPVISQFVPGQQVRLAAPMVQMVRLDRALGHFTPVCAVIAEKQFAAIAHSALARHHQVGGNGDASQQVTAAPRAFSRSSGRRQPVLLQPVGEGIQSGLCAGIQMLAGGKQSAV
jgi:hypothetical protein